MRVRGDPSFTIKESKTHLERIYGTEYPKPFGDLH
jgi:hypothetical protein